MNNEEQKPPICSDCALSPSKLLRWKLDKWMCYFGGEDILTDWNSPACKAFEPNEKKGW